MMKKTVILLMLSVSGAAQAASFDDTARVIGYTVTYDYNGRVFMRSAPSGDTLKVRVNLTPSTGG